MVKFMKPNVMEWKISAEEIRKNTPGPVARHLNKRISLPISIWLAKRGMHPNWITLINMILGVSTGFFVAKGTYVSMLLGAFLFQLASIFDGCDGEIAKLTSKTSKFGQYFDSLSDNAALISFLIGLIVVYAQHHNTQITVGMGSLLLAGLGGLLWQMIQYLKKYTQSASLATFHKEYLSKLSPQAYSPFFLRSIRYGKTLMSKDCFSLLFFISALIGILPWWLYIVTFGTWIANGALLYLKWQPVAKKSLSSILTER